MEKKKRHSVLKRATAVALSLMLAFTGLQLSGLRADAAEPEGVETVSKTQTEPDTAETVSMAQLETETTETASRIETASDKSETVDRVFDESSTIAGAFDKSETVDGVSVRVKADPGVLPEGAALSVRKVYFDEKQSVEAAVDSAREDGKNIAKSLTYDIKVLDENGNEIEPDTSKGTVRVSFSMAEAGNQNLSADIYHIGDDMNAKKLDSSKTTDDGVSSVSAETDGFSYYTVEFTYGQKQYVMDGDTEVPLQDILDYVGITGIVTNVSTSNSELFSAEQRDGVWYISANQAFSSNEWLRVTLDGVGMEVEIVVTDENFDMSTNIADGTVMANGDTISRDGYTITLYYAPAKQNNVTAAKNNQIASDTGTVVGSITIDSSKATGYNDVSKWCYYHGFYKPRDMTADAYVVPAYVLHFEANGGTGVDGTHNYASGDNSYSFETPSRSGYNFLGWKRRGSSGGYETSFSETGKGGDVYFDAVWSAPATAPTLTSWSGTYDKKEHTVTVGTTSGLGGTVYYRIDGGGWSTTLPKKTNTGTYKVEAYTKAVDAEHTDSGITSANFTILQKEVGLSWANDSFTYDGNTHAPTATATNVISGDTCTVTVTGGQAKVGTYTATASKLSNDNYKLPSSTTKGFTINPCVTTIDITVPDVVYTGGELKPAPTVKAVNNGNKTIDASEYTASYSNNKDAGTATVSIADKDGGNYVITQNSQTFAVIPKKLDDSDISQGVQKINVDAIPAQTYSGRAITPDINVTYNGMTLMEERDFDVNYSNNINAGTATVTLTGHGNYQGTTTRTFTINPLSLTDASENFALNISGTQYTYNGTPKVPDERLSRGSAYLVEDSDYTVSYKNSNTGVRNLQGYGNADPNAIDAGTITLRVTGKGNYKDFMEITYDIVPMEVEVYGLKAVDREYDGTKVVQINKSSATLHGYIAGDEVSISTAETAEMEDAKVGEGKIVNLSSVTLSGKHASNYVLTSVDPVRVNISKRNLSDTMFSFAEAAGVTIDGNGAASVVYNSVAQTPRLNLTDLNGTINILSSSDVAIEYRNNIHAGTAVITITAADDGNYKGSVTKTFTIKKAPLKITAGNWTSVYGTEINYPETEYTVAGTIYNDVDRESLAIKSVTSVKKGYAVGEYGGANSIIYNTENKDYDVTTEKGRYNVTAGPASEGITVTTSPYAGIYDGEEHTFSINAKGLFADDVFEIYYSSGTELTDSNFNTAGTKDGKPGFSDAGVHTVYYYVRSDNYSGGRTGSVTVTINKAPLSVSVTEGVEHSITYGEAVNISEAGLSNLTISGFVNDEQSSVSGWSGTVSYTSDYQRYGDVGEYHITPEITDAEADLLFKNYAITYHSGKLTVVPKPVTFTWPENGGDEKTYEYTGHEIYHTATVDGVVNNDDVEAGGYVTSGIVSGEDERSYAFSAIEKGKYRSEVTALSGGKAANYCIAENNSTMISDWSIVEGGEVTPGTETRTIMIKAKPVEGKESISFGESMSSSDFTYTFEVKNSDGTAIENPPALSDISEGTIKYSTDYTTGSGIGSYTNTPYGLSGKTVPGTAGPELINISYTVEYVSGSFGVTRAANEISDPVISDWYYGDSASEPKASSKFGEVAFQYQAATEGNTEWTSFDWKNSSSVPTAAGEYTLKASVAGTNNYTGCEKTVTFKILPAEATITLKDKNGAYGSAVLLDDSDYTLTVAKGKLSGSDVASLNIQPSTEATDSSQVGTYPITASYTGSPNISVSVNDAVYTITRKTIKIKEDEADADGSNSVTYDGKPHTINAPKLVDSEGNPLPEGSYTVYYSTKPLDADSYGSGSTTPPTVKDAVNTTIYYYIKSDNYGDFSGRAAVSIAKKELTVAARDSEISFGTDPVNNGVTYSGFAEGEDESVL